MTKHEALTTAVRIYFVIRIPSFDIRHFGESSFRFSKTALLLNPVTRECSFRKL